MFSSKNAKVVSRSTRPAAAAGGRLRGALVLLAGLILPVGVPDLASAADKPVSTVCSGQIGVTPLAEAPTLPTNFASIGGQIAADCLAWQTFISLNWAADPAHPGQPDTSVPWSLFGVVRDPVPKVWETYLEAGEVFDPDNNGKITWRDKRSPVLKLSALSELGDIDLSLSSIAQAGDGKWLTNQMGGLTYYEVRLNEDEFDFITQNVFDGNDLTTFAGQAACAAAGTAGKGGFNLPGGGGGSPTSVLDTTCAGAPTTYGTNVGAIEIKAAWTALPSDHSLDYRYLTAEANITDPYGNKQTATVGLVGLHIIHKMPGAQQFVWSTFEQIDNTPNQSGNTVTPPNLPANPNQITPPPPYMYYSANCDPTTNPYKCQPNALPGKPCDSSGSPVGCDPYSAPIQTTRIVAVDTIANNVTGGVWSMLPEKSVFNYYRLINVQWPQQSTPVPPGAIVCKSGQTSVNCVPAGNITPSANSGIVANTTLETYQQSSNACMNCHQNAPIARQKAQKLRLLGDHKLARRVEIASPSQNGAIYSSDYTFVFSQNTVH